MIHKPRSVGDALCQHFGNRRRHQLAGQRGIVFGFVVEELVFADDFAQRQHQQLTVVAEHAAGQLATFHIFFDEDFGVFGKSLVDGRYKLFGMFYFAHPHTRSTGIGFYKNRERELLHDFICIYPLAGKKVNRTRGKHAVRSHHPIAVIFVEGERRDQRTRSCKRNAEHLKICRQTAIFAGSAVDGTKNTVEMDAPVGQQKAEVIFIDRKLFFTTLVKPFASADMDKEGIVFLGIERLGHHGAAFYRNIMFA